MRKKIIIIISVISLFIVIFSISSLAFDENDYGKPYIENGSTITFNESVSLQGFSGISFTFDTNNLSSFKHCISMTVDSNRLLYHYNTGYGAVLVPPSNWQYNGCNVIYPTQDKIITEEQATWLQNNTDYLIVRVPYPPTPTPMENAYEYSNNFLSSAFNSISQITNFISNNAVICILTVGILIVSFVLGLLHRIRKRTFKSR